ncbi:GSCOCG00007836001-RA-CDS [Cotesia congregata]|nr:GSCOCG00007836001-RA-CDS [Cotesia congregata]
MVFYCSQCTYSSAEIKRYIKHLKIHPILTGQFICGYNHCGATFRFENSLRSHINRSHNFTREEAGSLESNNKQKLELLELKCNVLYCTQKFDDIKKFKTHLNNHIKDGVAVQCYFPECNKTYRKVNSLSSHISINHNEKELKFPSSESGSSVSVCR